MAEELTNNGSSAADKRGKGITSSRCQQSEYALQLSKKGIRLLARIVFKFSEDREYEENESVCARCAYVNC
jgi:hypothetical protein